MPERIQDVLLTLAFQACDGHHILLRLLSLHLCNEYPSLPKKKKKKKKGASYIGRGDGWAPPARGSLAGWSCDVTSPEGGVLIPCSFRLLSRRRLDLAMCCLPRCSLSVAMSVERSDIGHHTLGTL